MVVVSGDVWWLEAPGAHSRPVLVVTRSEAIPVLASVVVAPITSTLRDAPSQLPLGPAEGLPRDCVANFDSLTTVRKALLTRHLGSLGVRHHELCETLRRMSGC